MEKKSWWGLKRLQKKEKKNLHRSILLKPADTQTSTKKQDLKDSKDQLN